MELLCQQPRRWMRSLLTHAVMRDIVPVARRTFTVMSTASKPRMVPDCCRRRFMVVVGTWSWCPETAGSSSGWACAVAPSYGIDG
jgi:hypothetical protein